MDELQRHYKAERNKALADIEKAANQLAEQTRREAELAQEFAPCTILEGHERHYVASHVPLVEADVAALDVEELAARLQGVLHDSSKSTRLLYWQAARKRARDLHEARTAGSPAITRLDGVLCELDEALFGEERRRRQAGPKRLAEAASEVAGMCLLGRHEAKSIYGVHVAKSGGHIRPQSTTIDPGTYSVGGSLAGVNVR